MFKIPLRQCSVCGNVQKVEVLYTQAFAIPESHILFEAKKFDIVSCDICGFVYNDTPLSQEVYSRYYSEMSKYEADYYNIDYRNRIPQAELIASLIQNTSESIIDVGCGDGGLLVALKKIGIANLTALDPSRVCINNVEKNGITGIVGDVFQNSLSSRYGLSVLSHVLEHIYDVKKAVNFLKNIMSENGYIYIEVPDSERYHDYYVAPFHYFDMEHINHFDETSLANLGAMNGLKVKTSGRRDVRVSESVIYPAIYVLYEKTDDAPVLKKGQYGNVIKYIEKSKNSGDINRTISVLADSGKPVVIWGAGAYTMRLLKDTGLGKCNIEFFIDKDLKKQGMEIQGKRVFGQDALKNISSNYVIAVCSAVFSDEIVSEIKKMKLDNQIVVIKA